MTRRYREIPRCAGPRGLPSLLPGTRRPPSSKRRRAAYLTIGGLTGAALSGGIAFAAIPSAGGAYTGCVATLTGVLRVVDWDAGQRCLPVEKRIDWNATGPVGPQGPQGPQGQQGPQGDQGAPGAPGIGELERLHSDTATVMPGTSGWRTAWCPRGTRVISGGFDTSQAALSLRNAYWVHKSDDLVVEGWFVEVHNESAEPQRFSAIAQCARIG